MGHQKPRPLMDLPSMTEAEEALFEERAAIREFMGGLARPEAEAAAREDVRRILASEREPVAGWRERIKP